MPFGLEVRREVKRVALTLPLVTLSQLLGVWIVAKYTHQPIRWSTFWLLAYLVNGILLVTSYRKIVRLQHPDSGSKQFGVGFLLTLIGFFAVWLAILRWDVSTRDSASLLRRQIEQQIQPLIGTGRVSLSSDSLFVQVQRPDFDDQALQELATISQLLKLVPARFFLLDLTGTKVTDKGLASLSELHQLEFLILDSTPVTTDGLKVIKQMPKLQVLSVRETAVPLEHLNGLRQARPSLQISPNEQGM